MRMVAGVIEEAPVVEERAVEFGEVADAEVKAAELHVVRNIVAAFGDALAHTIARDVEMGNPEKIELDEIAGGAQLTEERGVGATG